MYLTIQSHSLDDASLMTNNEFSLAESNGSCVIITIFNDFPFLLHINLVVFSNLVFTCFPMFSARRKFKNYKMKLQY